MERWTLLAFATGLISASSALGVWAVVESTAGADGGVTDLLVMALTTLVLGVGVLMTAIATPGRRGPGGG